MKQLLMLLYLVLASAWSCETGHLEDASLLDKDWVLIQIQDTKSGALIDFPADAQREITIFLDGNSNCIYFHGVCNFGAGTYEFTSARGEIIIKNIDPLSGNCNYVEWESYTTQNLENNSGYRINGDMLTVFSKGAYNLIFTSK